LGLYYLRARYYNPQTGRFLSRDPEDGNRLDPATLHIYDMDGTASYYVVAIPERPLHLTDLPDEIAEMVSRVRSPFLFGTTTHFKEVDTLEW
jgi:uncharacterized protein RhaS with RHS repeats